MTRLLGLMLLPVLAALTGCSTYIADYYYVPRPAVVNIPLAGGQGSPAAPPATQPAAAGEQPAAVLLASVIGIRRADAGKNLPEMVEIRIRVESRGEPVTVDPRSVDLVTGTLVPLAPPTLTPEAAFTLPPNSAADVVALFPLPPTLTHETLDLTALRLRARLSIGPRPAAADITFQRLIPVYADPYYDPYYDPWWPYYGPRAHFFFGYHGGRRW